MIFYELHCFPREPAISEVQRDENPSLKRVPFLDQRLKANDTLREFVNLDAVGSSLPVPFLADLSHKTFVLPSFLPYSVKVNQEPVKLVGVEMGRSFGFGLRFLAVTLSVAGSGYGAGLGEDKSCPNALVRAGEKLVNSRRPKTPPASAGVPDTGLESMAAATLESTAAATTSERNGPGTRSFGMAAPATRSLAPMSTPTAKAATTAAPVSRLESARAAVTFLIEASYDGPTAAETGAFRSSSPAMLLHRNRLRVLLGADQEVPLAFLTELESRARYTTMAGRALEERLWVLERERLQADPKFQPEPVRHIVTIISQVLERKEIKPLSDFVLQHYEDALSILGVSNEVDELRWKVIALLMEEKLGQETEHPLTPAPGFWSRVGAVAHYFHNKVNQLFWRTPEWKKVAKDLLMALASSDHQPLDQSSIKGLLSFARSISDPDRRQLYELQLGALIQREQELTRTLVNYFRHYRAATLLKKLLHDLACADGREGLESYNLARQAMKWTLDNHPYVRHVVESGLVGATEVYHPYLCLSVPFTRPVSQLADPILAAQALTPQILSLLYDESMRAGLEALVREWDVRAADKTLAGVEQALKESLFTVGKTVVAGTVGGDPIYERLIGPALAPLINRLKGPEGLAIASNSATDEPAEAAGKKKKTEAGSEEPSEKTVPVAVRPKENTPSKVGSEPFAVLLQQIKDYLGPDSTKIPWGEIAVPTAPPLSERSATVPVKKPETESRSSEDPSDSETSWDDMASEPVRRPIVDTEFAKSYHWVDSVYELLNTRAEKIRAEDMEIESLQEAAKLTGVAESIRLDGRRAKLAEDRQKLIDTFLNVQHAVEACILGQQAARNRAATDDQVATDALRVAAFYVKKHRHLGRFLVSHAHTDTSLRELWMRLFLRVASGHLDLNPSSPYPIPALPDANPSLWNRWGKIASYGCGVAALTIGGSVVMYTKGCNFHTTPTATTTPTVVTAPAEPGGKGGTTAVVKPGGKGGTEIKVPEKPKDGSADDGYAHSPGEPEGPSEEPEGPRF